MAIFSGRINFTIFEITFWHVGSSFSFSSLFLANFEKLTVRIQTLEQGFPEKINEITPFNSCLSAIFFLNELWRD